MVGRALEVVGDETRVEEPGTSAFLHVDRAILEVLQGHEDAARRRVGHLRRGRAGGGRQLQARGTPPPRDLDGRPRGGPGADEGGAGHPARRGVSGHGGGHPGAHRGSGSGCGDRQQPALGPAPRAPRARRAPRRPAPRPVHAGRRPRRPGVPAAVGGGDAAAARGRHGRGVVGRGHDVARPRPTARHVVLPVASRPGGPPRRPRHGRSGPSQAQAATPGSRARPARAGDRPHRVGTGGRPG